MKLPTAFRTLVEDRHGTSLYITSVTGYSVLIYPMPIWLVQEEKIARMPSSLPARQKLLDRVNYYGMVAEFDTQGRVLLPPRLRADADMSGDVDVLGKVDYLDVWNHDRLVAKMANEPYTDDDANVVAGYGA